jgi:hypothetical protein
MPGPATNYICISEVDLTFIQLTDQMIFLKNSI